MGIEISHRHAVNFNQNTDLRSHLQQSGFVSNKAAPQLLSQEILSIELLLSTIFRLYTTSSTAVRTGSPAPSPTLYFPYDANHEEVRAFAQPWVRRMSIMVLWRYVLLEDLCEQPTGALPVYGSNVSSNGIQHYTEGMVCSPPASGVGVGVGVGVGSSLVHNTDRYALYDTAVGIVLRSVLDFGVKEFLDHRDWLLPLLARLVRCSNAMLRALVSDIYSVFINPLVMQMKIE